MSQNTITEKEEEKILNKLNDKKNSINQCLKPAVNIESDSDVKDKKLEKFHIGIAASLESITSTLGIFMMFAVPAELAQLGMPGLYGCLGIALIFGAFICFYTYKLLKRKEEERANRTVENNDARTTTTVLALLVTTIAAGLDAASALIQNGVSSSTIAISTLCFLLAALSFLCRASKYYFSDLGTQVSRKDLIYMDSTFENEESTIGAIVRFLVFQLFAIGEALAHFLAGYILYTDLISPYLIHSNILHVSSYGLNVSTLFNVISLFLIVASIYVCAFALFSQYCIICGADSEWAALTLDGENQNGISSKIDNRFGAVGRFLFWLFAKRVLKSETAQKAYERLKKQIEKYKKWGQGFLVGAAGILLVSIVATRMTTTEVSGSLNNVSGKWGWVIAIAVFVTGFIGGYFLGRKQFKAKDANHEMDLICAGYVINNKNWSKKQTETLYRLIAQWKAERTKEEEPDDSDIEHKKLPPHTWITKQQGKRNSKHNEKAIIGTYIFFILSGAGLGLGYAIETVGTSNNMLHEWKFYAYTLGGALAGLFIAYLIFSERVDLVSIDPQKVEVNLSSDFDAADKALGISQSNNSNNNVDDDSINMYQTLSN